MLIVKFGLDHMIALTGKFRRCREQQGDLESLGNSPFQRAVFFPTAHLDIIHWHKSLPFYEEKLLDLIGGCLFTGSLGTLRAYRPLSKLRTCQYLPTLARIILNLLYRSSISDRAVKAFSHKPITPQK